MDTASLEFIRELIIPVGRFSMESVLKEAHQVKPTNGHPSCIQQLCKDNTQLWTQPPRN